MAPIEKKKKRKMAKKKQPQTLKIESNHHAKIETLDAGNIKNKMERKNRVKLFQGRKPIDRNTLRKYQLGAGVQIKHLRKDPLKQHKIKRKEQAIKKGEEEAARAEVLLTESSGLLEVNEGTYTSHVTQRDIRDSVDITAATKSFDLTLDQFGPYKLRYTRNGRHLALAGRKGHLATLDWVTKRLHCEVNVTESIHDVCWLHTEEMVAVAQKKWVFIYDRQGTEMHCLKKLDQVLRLEFLPYHFLLCAGSENGFLSWLDVTLGKEVTQTLTRKGRLEVMCQNIFNAVLCCGHANGTVTMWTPNDPKPVASILCHKGAVRAIDVDPVGRYLATAGIDRSLKIWDVRKLGKVIESYQLNSAASYISFSQKGLLGVASGNVVEVYSDVNLGIQRHPYMRQLMSASISGLQFCPYEDVLGVATYKGFSSLIIPGAGEANFDALEANPFMSSSARREAEVKSLLAKVPSTLISLDPRNIAQVDVPTLQEKLQAREQLLHVRVPKIDITPRYKTQGKSGSAAKFHRKMKTKEVLQKEVLKEALAQREELLRKEGGGRIQGEERSRGVLGRFVAKKMVTK